MTGLLLYVPPKRDGEATNVLLPVPPVGARHVALLGVGIERDSLKIPHLCLAYKAALDEEICYVKLDDWSLDPIGTGGTTVTVDALEKLGAPNVTRGSGGLHKVDLAKLDTTHIRSRIVFTGGSPGRPCSLGRWKYKPPMQDEAIIAAANVLRWELTLPAEHELVFRLKTDQDSIIRLPLIPRESNRVHIVLAHLPEQELAHLPPAEPKRPGKRPDANTPPQHFTSFYNLLSKPDGAPGEVAAKTLPQYSPNAGPVGPCVIRVTSRSARVAKLNGGVRTFACVPASAEPGP